MTADLLTLPALRPASVFSIDPGNEDSAYTLVGVPDAKPLEVAKASCEDVLTRLRDLAGMGQIGYVTIEMIASYGMAVGRDVFETCVWIGRYEQAALDLGLPVERIVRKEVKLHLCGSSKATDSNISQALKDRFAYGVRNHGKGTKDAPGFFYGFKADCWQAYALGVLKVDRLTGNDL
jgi:hypothetical protein